MGLKPIRKGKIRYKTDPEKENRKAQVAILAKSKEKLIAVQTDAKVLKLVKQGHTFDEVSEKLGVSPAEAMEMTKKAIDRWCGELSLDAKQNRELDLKRIDAILVILWNDIEPQPLRNKDGDVVRDEGGNPVMKATNLDAVKVYNQLLGRRAAMLGLDSEKAAIQTNVQVNLMERRYVGANPDDL